MSQEPAVLKELFANSRNSITAIGHETRQAIILTLMEGPVDGMRVGNIKEHTHLSQPAVSHHLKKLCDANIVTLRKIGTMNFYRLNPDREEIKKLYHLCKGILEVMSTCEEQADN